MDSEDPLFILYTSGSTGKPKGVLHTTAGYLLHAAVSHRLVFDYKDGDIYWCTADVGWVTGHSYIVYGPLANGATTLMFEGVPNYPNAGRFWQVVDRHKVNIFYTAPTALRALMAQGEAPVKSHSRASLRLLGTVGEPINPEAWEWYHRVVGDRAAPSWTPGGRPRPAASSSRPCPVPSTRSRAPRPCPSSASCNQRSSMTRARNCTAPAKASWSSSSPGRARCAPCTATTSASSTPTSRQFPGWYFGG